MKLKEKWPNMSESTKSSKILLVVFEAVHRMEQNHIAARAGRSRAQWIQDISFLLSPM